MPKYLVTATRVINYEIEIEAVDEFDAYNVLDDYITDDFTEVGSEFTIDYILEVENV